MKGFPHPHCLEQRSKQLGPFGTSGVVATTGSQLEWGLGGGQIFLDLEELLSEAIGPGGSDVCGASGPPSGSRGSVSMETGLELSPCPLPDHTSLLRATGVQASGCEWT